MVGNGGGILPFRGKGNCIPTYMKRGEDGGSTHPSHGEAGGGEQVSNGASSHRERERETVFPY